MSTAVQRGAGRIGFVVITCVLGACRREPDKTGPAPSSSAPTGSAPRDVEEHAFVAPSVGFYAVLLPPGYHDPSQTNARFPLVAILHGSGSTELAHGTLADDFGRDGVIYVAVRAPYPSAESFIDNHRPGWTAWPYYPDSWGKFDNPNFPKAEAELLKMDRLYTTWIAAALTDVRGRYRVSPERAVVVGHSQGGTFAHRFAVEHPEMVKAYVAIAGRHEIKLSDPADAAVLREHGIGALVMHREADRGARSGFSRSGSLLGGEPRPGRIVDYPRRQSPGRGRFQASRKELYPSRARAFER